MPILAVNQRSDRRQIVIRTAMQRRFVQIPLGVGFPGRVLELVLHIEQPDADRGGEKHDRKMNEQHRLDADQPASATAIDAIARLVAMVLAQGRQPARISPKGRRCCKKNR